MSENGEKKDSDVPPVNIGQEEETPNDNKNQDTNTGDKTDVEQVPLENKDTQDDKEDKKDAKETEEKIAGGRQEDKVDDQVLEERWIKIRKNQVTVATAAVTKQKNKIMKLMVIKDNLNFVKDELESYRNDCLHYHDCYENYIKELDESAKEKEAQRHEDKSLTMLGFETHVNTWIKGCEQDLQDQLDSAYAISKRSKQSAKSDTSKHLLNYKKEPG